MQSEYHIKSFKVQEDNLAQGLFDERTRTNQIVQRTCFLIGTVQPKARLARHGAFALSAGLRMSHGVGLEACRIHMRRMWTMVHRQRQKAFERRRHPTDPASQPARRGRKPKANLREILNASAISPGAAAAGA
jgi:hypothetical protein